MTAWEGYYEECALCGLPGAGKLTIWHPQQWVWVHSACARAESEAVEEERTRGVS